MKRVPPSKRTKEAISAILSGIGGGGDPRSELVRLADLPEPVMEAVLLGEVSGGGRELRNLAASSVQGRGREPAG